MELTLLSAEVSPMTQCGEDPIRFQGPERRRVAARFDDGWVSPDGGSLLLEAGDRVPGSDGWLPASTMSGIRPARSMASRRCSGSAEPLPSRLVAEPINIGRRVRCATPKDAEHAVVPHRTGEGGRLRGVSPGCRILRRRGGLAGHPACRALLPSGAQPPPGIEANRVMAREVAGGGAAVTERITING